MTDEPDEEIPELKFSKRKFAGRKVIDAQEYKAAHNDEKSLTRQVSLYLTANRIDYLRIDDEVYRLVKVIPWLLTHTKIRQILPPWMKVTLARVAKVISENFKGVPDFIISRPLKNGYNISLMLELKTEKGEMSQGQENYGRLQNVKISRSFEDAVSKIEKFMKYEGE